MVKRDILGEEIWECSPKEARDLWRTDPVNRHRIWTHAEVDAHLLSGTEILAEIIEQKRQKPGSCL